MYVVTVYLCTGELNQLVGDIPEHPAGGLLDAPSSRMEYEWALGGRTLREGGREEEGVASGVQADKST